MRPGSRASEAQALAVPLPNTGSEKLFSPG